MLYFHANTVYCATVVHVALTDTLNTVSVWQIHKFCTYPKDLMISHELQQHRPFFLLPFSMSSPWVSMGGYDSEQTSLFPGQHVRLCICMYAWSVPMMRIQVSYVWHTWDVSIKVVCCIYCTICCSMHSMCWNQFWVIWGPCSNEGMLWHEPACPVPDYTCMYGMYGMPGTYVIHVWMYADEYNLQACMYMCIHMQEYMCGKARVCINMPVVTRGNLSDGSEGQVIRAPGCPVLPRRMAGCAYEYLYKLWLLGYTYTTKTMCICTQTKLH